VVAVVTAHDRIAEQIWGVVVAAIRSKTERPIGGMQFELADATTIAHGAAKNVLAVLPELLTDERIVRRVQRGLGWGDISARMNADVPKMLAAAAKALTEELS
jgi:hypothetical protein